MEAESKIGTGFTLRPSDVLPILRMQRNIILLFLATVLVVTLIGSLMTQKEYRATAVIQIAPRAGREVRTGDVMDQDARTYLEEKNFTRTQIEIMQSRSLREEVVRQYNELGYDDLLLESGGASVLSRLMAIVPRESSQLVDVSVTHTDPERAAVLANLIAKVYTQRNLESRRTGAVEARDWLQNQLREYDQKVDELNRALFEFKEKNDMVDADDAITSLSSRMSALNESYGDLSTQRVLLETNVKSYEDLLGNRRYAELSRVMDSPVFTGLTEDYARQLAEDAKLAARYGDKHPERRYVQAQLERIQSDIDAEVMKMVKARKVELEILEAKEANLVREIEGTKLVLLEKQRLKAEYEKLSDELKRTKSMYDALSARNDELDLTSRTQLNNVQIIDTALPPGAPIKPNISFNMIVGLVAGLLGGIGIGFLREYIDDTVSSPLDVAAYLGVQFLGLIPMLPNGGTNGALYTHENPRSSVAEAARALRTVLELNPHGRAPKRLLVTSSVASEGKTGTSTRLGIAFAQLGKRVVIIDADLRRPRIHHQFEIAREPGVADVLLGNASLDVVLRDTPVPNLTVITAGRSTDQPHELLAGEEMSKLLTDLDRIFDMVIIDTPPCAVLSDALMLSKQADGVVVVVREHAVSRLVVKQTLDRLRQVQANILGVVLNAVDMNNQGAGYRYYYGYRNYYYTYGYDERGRPEKDKSAAK